MDITVPDYPKCIICVAPHTSNWDFIIGKLAYASVGRKAGFLMKSSWFFFPLGYIFKAMGGIPVKRKKSGISLVEALIHKFQSSPNLTLAITPEGTRSKTCVWHTGFLAIASGAGVPVLLGAIDYKHKKVIITERFAPTGNTEDDIASIKRYYRNFMGLYPEKFCAD